MKRVFVDTNVWVRLIADDSPDQKARSLGLLSQAGAGDFLLISNVVVVAEVVWVLRNRYGLTTSAVRDFVLALAVTPGVQLENEDLVVAALHESVSKNLGFADAYAAVWSAENSIEAAATFDIRHFRRLGFGEVLEF